MPLDKQVTFGEREQITLHGAQLRTRTPEPPRPLRFLLADEVVFEDNKDVEIADADRTPVRMATKQVVTTDTFRKRYLEDTDRAPQHRINASIPR